MQNFTFKAIGTQWSILVDDAHLTKNEEEGILNYVGDFERRFSRFLSDSEVNAFRSKEAGRHDISKEFALLLEKADVLREITEGTYDPAVALLLEDAGYDSSYSLQPRDTTEGFALPEWELEGSVLITHGPVVFDLGGIGKGYCIDRVSDLVRSLGYKNYIVEAGGDMFGTTKSDGSPWRVAIQFPGKEDTAAGVVELRNEALAVSDSFRRRWGKWHHIVNPKQCSAIEHIIGVTAIAANAWDADCMTSALFLSDEGEYRQIAGKFNAAYLVFKKEDKCLVSPNWEGELFT